MPAQWTRDPELLDIYAAMVIGHRARDRDLSDEQALERCKPDVRTAITYVLGRIEATGTSLDEETKHRLTMAQLRGMPGEMLDRAYNLLPPGAPRHQPGRPP